MNEMSKIEEEEIVIGTSKKDNISMLESEDKTKNTSFWFLTEKQNLTNKKNKSINFEEAIKNLSLYEEKVKDKNIKQAIRYVVNYNFEDAIKILKPSHKTFNPFENLTSAGFIPLMLNNTKKLRLSKKIEKISKIFSKEKNLFSNSKKNLESIKKKKKINKSSLSLKNLKQTFLDNEENICEELELFKSPENLSLIKENNTINASNYFFSLESEKNSNSNKQKYKKKSFYEFSPKNKNNLLLSTNLPGKVSPNKFKYETPKIKTKKVLPPRIKSKENSFKLALKKNDSDFSFLQVSEKIDFSIFEDNKNAINSQNFNYLKNELNIKIDLKNANEKLKNLLGHPIENDNPQNNSHILVSPESNNSHIELLDNPFDSSISKFSENKDKIISEIIDYVDNETFIDNTHQNFNWESFLGCSDKEEEEEENESLKKADFILDRSDMESSKSSLEINKNDSIKDLGKFILKTNNN